MEITQGLKATGLAGALCVALAGCGKSEVPQHEDIRPVRTITASRTAGTVSANYSGEIRARYESKLGFKVSGKVIDRLVEVGSRVVPGQALLRLDPQDAVHSVTSAEAQTDAARVKLAQSRIDLERGERLVRDNIISQSAFDQTRLAYDTALSQLRSAEAQQQLSLNQRAYTVLTADRAGVVTAIDVEVGHVVAVGQAVLTEGEIVITAGVHMLHPGQKVKVPQPEIVLGSAQ